MITRVRGFVSASMQALRRRERGAILRNSSWLAGERALSFSLAMTVHVLMARYLGVEQFGLLSYAISFVGLFGAFTYLGFSGIVTRELVASEDTQHEVLGTTFVLKLAGAAVAVAIILAVGSWRPPEPGAALLIQILAVGLFFDAFRVVNFWFESRLESRYSVIATGGAALASGAMKLALIAGGAALAWFAVATAAQSVIAAAGAVALYRYRKQSVRQWRASSAMARRLFRESWPLLVSSVAAVVYLRIDQVMLGYLSDAGAVGVYSVAAKLSEVWYFLPGILATSLLPSIVRSRLLAPDVYAQRMQRIYDVMFLAGVAVAGVVSLAASPLVVALYGMEYQTAGTILSIHIWACPAMFMGAALSKWLIAEGYTTFSITRHAMGAVANVILNFLLIPSLGGVGAAAATVVSYTAASYVACFFDRRTRPAALQMTRAFTSPLRLRSVFH